MKRTLVVADIKVIIERFTSVRERPVHLEGCGIFGKCSCYRHSWWTYVAGTKKSAEKKQVKQHRKSNTQVSVIPCLFSL